MGRNALRDKQEVEVLKGYIQVLILGEVTMPESVAVAWDKMR
jgi:hypothetical protein